MLVRKRIGFMRDVSSALNPQSKGSTNIHYLQLNKFHDMGEISGVENNDIF